MASPPTPGTPLPLNDNPAIPALPAYIWTGCGIVTVIIALRLYTRIVLKQTAGWDDFLIVSSYAFAMALWIGTQLLLSYGYGRHFIYIDPANVIPILKWSPVVNIVGMTSLALSRTSIGLFLLRLVNKVRHFAIPIYIGLGINVFQAVGIIIWTGIHCVPIQKTWTPDTPGFCIDNRTFTIVDRMFSSFNVVVDFLFAILPLFILRTLQTKARLRIAIYLLLSCGLLASICSIGRVVVSDFENPDITYTLIPLSWWAISEVNGVLILACMPALHQFVVYIGRTPAWNSVQGRIGSSIAKFSAPVSHVRVGSPQNLDSPQQNINVRKDVYVELTDRNPSTYSDSPVSPTQGRYSKPAFAQASASIV